MANIETVRVYTLDYESNPAVINAHSPEGEPQGRLAFYWPQGKKPAFIEGATVTAKKRSGVGRGLVRQFCQAVGPQVPVQGTITHEDTIRYITEEVVSQKGPETTITGEQLGEVPIARFLESGGITVTEVTVKTEPTGALRVNINGITR